MFEALKSVTGSTKQSLSRNFQRCEHSARRPIRNARPQVARYRHRFRGGRRGQGRAGAAPQRVARSARGRDMRLLGQSDEERERPAYWRFWRAMPARGRIGIFFGSWFTTPIIRRVYGEIKRRRFEAELERIAAFEKMLVADGAVIVKFWLHLPRKEQRRALERLEKMNRATPTDWEHFRLYKKFRSVSEQAGRATSSYEAPWHVIEATDRRYREFTVGSILLKTLKEISRRNPPPNPRCRKSVPSIWRIQPLTALI